jgi:hypothetical protein
LSTEFIGLKYLHENVRLQSGRFEDTSKVKPNKAINLSGSPCFAQTKLMEPYVTDDQRGSVIRQLHGMVTNPFEPCRFNLNGVTRMLIVRLIGLNILTLKLGF